MGRLESNQDPNVAKTWPPAQADFPALVPIPEHQLLCCIDRGSYGQVWLAKTAMGAYRAVKIVFRDSFQRERPFERELAGIQKFEPISRLHEGFIDVLQVGINKEGGYFYYIMELGDDEVSGRQIEPASYVPKTLASAISRDGKLPLQECLRFGLALTQALAELHKHGLVHRDIKPSNIVFVDGVPKLADIGLVTDADDTCSYVGTEGFIPPEGPGSSQADIYSLGKVLYEASTGNDRHDFPEIPNHWSQSPEYEGLLELNEIILKACKPHLSDRYSSDWDMHADLVMLLNGKSVKRLRLLEKRMAQIKRATGVSALVLALVGIILYQVYREWRIGAEERQRQVNANTAYGNRAVEAADLLGALPYFAEALRLDHGNTLREATHRLRLSATLALCPTVTRMWFAPMQVSDGEFSPDDSRVLLAQYFGKAQIYDLETGELYLHPFGPQFGLRSAIYSPDGRFILTTSESHTAIVWDAESLTQIVSLPHPDKVYMGRFSPDGHRIVTACNDGVARVWDAKTGQAEFALLSHAGIVAFAGFSHDGRLIVTASHDGTARIWHAEDGRPATAPLLHPMWVNCAGFSPDDHELVTACEDHKARVWEVGTSRQIMPNLDHHDAVKSAEFSPDGRLILTTSFDGTARLWGATDHQPQVPNAFLRHGERVTHACFSSDARQIVTTCVDGSVRVWDLAGATLPPPSKRRIFCQNACRYLDLTGDTLQVCNATDEKAVSATFKPSPVLQWARLSASGSFVLTCSLQANGEHLLQVWSGDTGEPKGPAVSNSGPFAGAALSDNGSSIAIYGGTLARVWSTRTGTAISSPMLHPEAVSSALFSPSTELLATISGTNVHVWHADTGQLAYPPLHFEVTVAYAAFSADGRLLVTCCSDATLARCSAQVWNVQNGRPVGQPLRHADGVLSASFNRASSRLVTASEDFTAKIWDVTTSRQVGLPLRHGAQVQAAAFSRSGQWLATASVDCTARLWDQLTGDPVTPPLRHLARLRDVRFLPDDHHLVTADGLGNTFEWNIPNNDGPIPDLVEIADFLSGGDFISPVSPVKGWTEPLSARWQRLRAKYPREFSVSKEQILRWHEFQAEQSEWDKQWAAAAFHLERLLRLRPDDQDIAEHLARVKKHLKHDD